MTVWNLGSMLLEALVLSLNFCCPECVSFGSEKPKFRQRVRATVFEEEGEYASLVNDLSMHSIRAPTCLAYVTGPSLGTSTRLSRDVIRLVGHWGPTKDIAH